MVVFCFALFLALFSLLALLLEKTYFYVPQKELKRQARRGTQPAATLFRAATYSTDLQVLLWLFVALGAGGSFILLARVAPPLLGFIAIVLLLLLGFMWLPRTRVSGIGVRLALWCTPVMVRLLRWWHPVGKYLSAAVSRYMADLHTGMYEREDMYDLLDRQQQQFDNRMGEEELIRMRTVLRLGDYRVRDIFIPREQVLVVDAEQRISPVLADELHQSGHVRFPVYSGKPTAIIGVLPLDAVSDIKRQGVVRDYFDEHIAYLHEEDTLEQALRAFYETRQHLFIVINNADAYMGIVTMSDILRCLFGAIEHEQFGRYEDRKAVRERHYQHKTADPSTELTEKTSEND